jgi:hypothetical protein
LLLLLPLLLLRCRTLGDSQQALLLLRQPVSRTRRSRPPQPQLQQQHH